ncbi:MAG: peptidoglycan DD-metalloendopeptidase family protein [Porphyromonadaceae bacterium]|nr:peptidoglycan DD-metalloendopeptidase family protein [Porphyromonadaceae bacterium]
MFVNKKVFRTVSCLLFILSITSCTLRQKKHSGDITQEKTERLFAYGICVDSLQVDRFVIQEGDNLASILLRLGFSGTEGENITGIISALYPPNKLKIGNTYAAITTQDTPSAVRYLVFESSKTDFVVVDFCSGSPKAYADVKPVTLHRRYAEKTITSSMWNAIIESGASPLLAMKLSDIYTWQIDFFDIKEGDSFRLIYDEAWIDDTTFVDIVDVAGAVFSHQGQEYMAIPFQQDSIREYFDADGNSLRKEFLKAPLDFFRISSKFSNARFHPVLKRYRPHHGVDYAAPSGTPVKTVGDGVVIEKSYQRGGAGNYLKIKHNNAYSTTYMHLSRFAKGIQKGTHVRQGEVIGYVGSTGLSTGPHLDYRVYKNNQPINPLKMEAPPSHPVKPELRDSFLMVRQNLMQLMDSLQQKG